MAQIAKFEFGWNLAENVFKGPLQVLSTVCIKNFWQLSYFERMYMEIEIDFHQQENVLLIKKLQAGPKLSPTYLITGLNCRAPSYRA